MWYNASVGDVSAGVQRRGGGFAHRRLSEKSPANRPAPHWVVSTRPGPVPGHFFVVCRAWRAALLDVTRRAGLPPGGRLVCRRAKAAFGGDKTRSQREARRRRATFAVGSSRRSVRSYSRSTRASSLASIAVDSAVSTVVELSIIATSDPERALRHRARCATVAPANP